ncbi:hypothetical protein [Candidatus Harpocratesius sp.]
MKNITIALPNAYVENLEKIESNGLIPSRSEEIRTAVEYLIKKDIKTIELMGKGINK